MNTHKNPATHKTIYDAEVYRKFKQMLEQGFVIVQNDEEITNPDLLDLSGDVAKILFRETGYQQRADTVNQFRKFFNEVRGLKALVNTPAKLGVELRMLRARMGYAAGRRTISEDFSLVINDCIDTMLKLGDFHTHIRGFCDVFEALYAYYYYHAKKRS